MASTSRIGTGVGGAQVRSSIVLVVVLLRVVAVLAVAVGQAVA